MLHQLHRAIRSVPSLSLFALLVVGCGAAREAANDREYRTRQYEEGERAPLAEFEATWRPSEYEDDITLLDSAALTAGEIVGPDADRDSVLVEAVVMQGFRIQILATSNFDEASVAKEVAEQLFEQDSVYVVFDPPLYRLRVGDYLTRFDASRALPQVINKGYPDAWVVSDRIVQRTAVRVPLSREK
jgi:hypothetical protein